MNIKQVAKKARVSTATVSRIINGSSAVRPKTAQRVRQAIRALNYYPNTHARTLVSGRSRILGLIISDISNPFFPELVKGFEDVALQNNYEVILTNTNYDSTRMASCVQRMLERKAEGVAIMTSEMNRQLIEELSRRGVPIVFLDVGSVRNRISNICVDYAQGIHEAVDHLCALGHRRIGFISGPLSLKSARTRRSSFLECLKQYDLAKEDTLIVEGNHKIDGGELAMYRLLQLKRAPTAVLTSNDLTAFGALRAIHHARLRVPEDISIVGFDDIELSQFTQPPLTTIRLPRTELGRIAFDALFRILRGDSQKGAAYRIETHLVVRSSTSAAYLLPGSQDLESAAVRRGS
ncbi:MAG: LacI family transcriptional regulator [Acidobacteriales bacterium 13_2_20CM_55_8]|jgi:LacI family transcriptional regulator|nr:MAG: LacI family transcriptional regulator [Acidobacteriales bacterium 13_2_20CM_55_8]